MPVLSDIIQQLFCFVGIEFQPLKTGPGQNFLHEYGIRAKPPWKISPVEIPLAVQMGTKRNGPGLVQRKKQLGYLKLFFLYFILKFLDCLVNIFSGAGELQSAYPGKIKELRDYFRLSRPRHSRLAGANNPVKGQLSDILTDPLLVGGRQINGMGVVFPNFEG